MQVFYNPDYSFKGDIRGRTHDILFKEVCAYTDRMLKSDIFGFNEKFNVKAFLPKTYD